MGHSPRLLDNPSSKFGLISNVFTFRNYSRRDGAFYSIFSTLKLWADLIFVCIIQENLSISIPLLCLGTAQTSIPVVSIENWTFSQKYPNKHSCFFLNGWDFFFFANFIFVWSRIKSFVYVDLTIALRKREIIATSVRMNNARMESTSENSLGA